MLPNTPLSGRYQLVAEIGRGGMGIVYKGLDLKLGGEVAIKVVRTDRIPVDSPKWIDYARDLVAEGQRLVQLRGHQNIVTLYDVEQHDGQPYVVMQLCQGQSLDSLLRSAKGKAASTGLVRSVASCIGSALQFAHDRGFLHCDVKPANILITLNGVPVLTDFGIARVTRDLLGANLGGFSGYTLAYASPEQVTGKELAPASDQYSLAVVLYEMVTSQRLVASRDQATEMAMDVLQAAPPAPSSFNPRVPRDLDEVLLRALSKLPEQRFASVEEFAREVVRALDDPTTKPSRDLFEGPDGLAATVTEPQDGETLPWRPSAMRLALVLVACAVLAAGVLYGSLGGGGADSRSSDGGRDKGSVGKLPGSLQPVIDLRTVAFFVREVEHNQKRDNPSFGCNGAITKRMLEDGGFVGLRPKGVSWPSDVVEGVDPLKDGDPDLHRLMKLAREAGAEFLLYGRVKVTTDGEKQEVAHIEFYRWQLVIELKMCRLVGERLEVLQQSGGKPFSWNAPDSTSTEVGRQVADPLRRLAETFGKERW